MIRLLSILLGAISGSLLSYGIAVLIGILIMPFYTPSGEDEMTRNFTIFLFVSFLLMIGGGILGNWLYIKTLRGQTNSDS